MVILLFPRYNKYIINQTKRGKKMNKKALLRALIVTAVYMLGVILVNMGLYALNISYLTIDSMNAASIVLIALSICKTKKIKNYIYGVA